MAEPLSTLRQRLQRHVGRDPVFHAPHVDVLSGKVDLFQSGGHVSSTVHVSQRAPYEPVWSDLESGTLIREGIIERWPKAELHCFRKNGRPVVALVKAGRLASMVLPLRQGVKGGNAWDEGYFTWFGPLEWVGTPWSDNDPETCQVVTVHDLRLFAGLRETS